MKKRYLGASASLIGLLLTGCGQGGNETNASETEEEVVVVPISVELSVPEAGNVHEEIQLSATVAQGDEKVNDADEVEYEIWEEGKKEDSWIVKSEQTSDGVYDGKAMFDRDGVYQVQVHVTARDMHTMPLKEITIGEGAVEPTEGKEDHGHHGTEGFSMHFMKPEDVKARESKSVSVHLQQDDSAFEHARVRLEVVLNEKADEAQWVTLDESKPGEYTGEVTFKEAGTASVTVHVEDDHELHEHETHEVTISE